MGVIDHVRDQLVGDEGSVIAQVVVDLPVPAQRTNQLPRRVGGARLCR
jgi:hypothetical protein